MCECVSSFAPFLPTRGVPTRFWQKKGDKATDRLPFCHPKATDENFSAEIFGGSEKSYYICIPIRHRIDMVDVAQLVRASDCGSEGRGFEPHLPPLEKPCMRNAGLFCVCPAFFQLNYQVSEARTGRHETFRVLQKRAHPAKRVLRPAGSWSETGCSLQKTGRSLKGFDRFRGL